MVNKWYCQFLCLALGLSGLEIWSCWSSLRKSWPWIDVYVEIVHCFCSWPIYHTSFRSETCCCTFELITNRPVNLPHDWAQLYVAVLLCTTCGTYWMKEWTVSLSQLPQKGKKLVYTFCATTGWTPFSTHFACDALHDPQCYNLRFCEHLCPQCYNLSFCE